MLIELSGNVFGNNLVYLRKKYKVSQTALAKLVGISFYTLKDWESGTRSPVIRHETLRRICAVFDISAEELLHSELH